MKIIYLSSLLLFCAAQFACAQPESQGSISARMEQFRRPVIALAPFMTDRSAFKATENEETIKTQLTLLKKNVSDLKGHPTVSNQAMPFTLEELQVQIDEVYQSFSSGGKEVARWQLQSSLGLCLHCHAQSPGNHSLSLREEDIQNLPQDAMNRADILFILRDFKQARETYQAILDQTHSFDSELNRLFKAFNRLLFLAVRFEQDFDRVISLIRSAQNEQRYPVAFRRQAQALQGFIDQQVFYRPVIEHLTDQELITFLADYQPEGRSFSTETDLYSAEELLELWLAGELYERLNMDKPADAQAKILHTLALIDERTGENIFYSLSNRYLEKCINLVPRTKLSRQCYEDLEERLTFSFSGSRGVDLPTDVKEKLLKLNKKATPTQD